MFTLTRRCLKSFIQPKIYYKELYLHFYNLSLITVAHHLYLYAHLSTCVFVCVLPNCVSAFLYDPEMRWHDVPLPPHTPHLSTVILLYSSPSQPTGWTRTEIQRLETVRLFIHPVKGSHQQQAFSLNRRKIKIYFAWY